ncbi:unnamed protein product [Darwinula stevensoni]|uniref:Septin-type G domain-containing protein n=1 Tax=Darwinula stevensoni TaxID=69355 RepID=A0A7R9A060_9CRUS|nr:unnamed protein product [Darwinula stevensoni]CAG0884914.1 unnamed protein product [Darwinula stevensoni]
MIAPKVFLQQLNNLIRAKTMALNYDEGELMATEMIQRTDTRISKEVEGRPYEKRLEVLVLYKRKRRKEEDNGVRSGIAMRRFVHRASMLETSAQRPDDPLFIRRRPCRGKVSPQLRLPSLSKRFEEYSPYYNLVLGDTLRRSFEVEFTVADVREPIQGADFFKHNPLLIDVSRRCLVDSETHLSVKVAEMFDVTAPRPTPTISFSIKTTGVPKPVRAYRLIPDKAQAAMEEIANEIRLGRMDVDGRQMEWLKGNSILRDDGKEGVDLYDVQMKTVFKENGLEKCVIGKSSFVNALFNYAVGVTYDDDFRFIIASSPNETNQEESQTKTVTAYSLGMQDIKGSRFRWALTIVDTPGFGDTGGIEEDRSNWQKIRKLFENGTLGLNRLHVIVFVVPATQVRINAREETLYSEITAMFGKDFVKHNFHILVTWALLQRRRPQVIASLEAAGVPTNKYFIVELGTFMEKTDKKAWEVQQKTLKNFCDCLEEGLKPVSLQLTKENLENLDNIENNLRQLKILLKERDKEEEKHGMIVRLHDAFKGHKRAAIQPYMPYVREFFEIMSEDSGVKSKSKKSELGFSTYEEGLEKMRKRYLQESQKKKSWMHTMLIIRNNLRSEHILNVK